VTHTGHVSSALIILVPPDDRPTGAAHPHEVALQAALQLTAITVLLEEGVEVCEDSHTLRV